MAGVHASLHIMVAEAGRMRMCVNRDTDCTYAFLHADDGHLTLSGPPDQIAATLRELADRVDETSRSNEEVR